MAGPASVKVPARAIGTPAAAATSWQNALLDSIRAAACDGPKTANPASRSASATPAASGASGPTTTSSAATERAAATTEAPSSASTPGQAADPWHGRDAGAAGGDDDLVDAGLTGELPGEGVLSAATAHDEDAGGHDQRRARAHAGIPARWRIGRHARSIVWVRSGPTDTSTMGTPACSSIAVR